MSNEQNIELQVRLEHDPRDGDDYNLLVINEGKHHHTFDKLQHPDHVHTISWTLAGNARGGEFCALDETANPGFMWLVRTPDGGSFNQLKRVAANKLSITNHHHGKASEGRWYYQLFARFGDQVYGVPLTFAAGMANNPNPSIKNT